MKLILSDTMMKIIFFLSGPNTFVFLFFKTAITICFGIIYNIGYM